MYFTALFYLSLVMGLTSSSDLPQATADCASIVSENQTGIVISITPPPADQSIISIDGMDFTSLEIPGEARLCAAGFPDLPVITRTLIVPSDARVSYNIISDGSVKMETPFPPAPFRDDMDRPLEMDVSQASGLYPPDAVELSRQGSFRGRKLIDVTFYPYQYDYDNREFIRHENVEVALEFKSETAGSNSDESKTNPSTLTRDSYRFLNGLALNMPRRDDGGANLPRGGYLIIVGSGFGAANNDIQQLAEWKRACGHYVEVYANRNEVEPIERLIRTGYEEWDPPLEYVCLVGDWDNPPAPIEFGDVSYSFFEGDDHIPEVAVGRILGRNPSQVQTAIRRLLSYQADPWRGELDWFNKAGAAALRVGSSTPAVNFTIHWVAEALRKASFDPVWTWYDQENNQDGDIAEWVADNVNVAFIRGRFSSNDFPVGANYPMILAIGGAHSCDYWPGMWILGSPDRLQGPSATVGTGDNPGTLQCNVMMGGLSRAVLLDGQSIGWARAYALTMLDYGGTGDFDSYLSEIRLLGDPAQHAWMGTPSDIRVYYPERTPPGTNRIEVRVTSRHNGSGMANALITITQSGEIVSWTVTDEDGLGVLKIDEALDDDVAITVTGDRIFPYSGQIRVVTQDITVHPNSLVIDDDEDGNDDGILNPGETIELWITARNSGNRSVAEGVRGIVASSSHWITFEAAETEFGDIGINRVVQARNPVILTLDASAPADADPGLYVDFISGHDSWRSNIDLEREGHQVQIVEIVNGDNLTWGMRNLILALNNTGSTSSPDMTVRLESFSPNVTVADGETVLRSLRPRGAETVQVGSLSISIRLLAVSGFDVPMKLFLTADGSDTPDTIDFNLRIVNPGGEPTGPDDYGYICFDNSDEEWERYPFIDWTEISLYERDRCYDGTRLGGNREENFAYEMDLPFSFKYYGEDYQQVTISENGFLALGEGLQSLRQYENFPLDRPMNGSFGMVAPFWDNLVLTRDNQDIYTYYDDDMDVFIIEWYNALIDDSGARVTFEVILFNPESHGVLNENGVIQFIYNDVPEPVQGTAPYYFSTGICCPEGKTGINYVSENRYAPGAEPIQNRSSMIFATVTHFTSPGYLHGHVYDAETLEPISEAHVQSSYRAQAVTDPDGYWSIPGARTEALFSLTVYKEAYNDSTKARLIVRESDSLEVNFLLLHPVFSTSHESIETWLESDHSQQFELIIENQGNGTLEWAAESQYRDNMVVDPWQMHGTFSVSQEVGNGNLEGMVFVEDTFYVTGRGVNEINHVYVLNRQGELVRSFQQPGFSSSGMRDLTWDGELIWGGARGTVYGITTEGEVRGVFRGPFTFQRAITWDPDREILWISGLNTDYVAGCNRDGELVAAFDRKGLTIRGLSYWSEDPDGYPIYIFHEPSGGRQAVSKFNPDTGDTMFVRELYPEGGGVPSGCFISSNYSIYSYTFIALTNRAWDDRIDVWQLDEGKNWLLLDEYFGYVLSGRSDRITLTLDATDFPDGAYQADLFFTHNAAGGSAAIPVTLTIGPNETGENQLALPLEFGISKVYPNPFNAETRIAFQLPTAASVSLRIYDVTGRLVTTLLEGERESGRYTATWDGGAMTSGVYIVSLETSGFRSVRKMMMCK